jgi:hypothetical protein
MMVSIALIPISQHIDLMLDKIKMLVIIKVTVLKWVVKIQFDLSTKFDYMERVIYITR